MLSSASAQGSPGTGKTTTIARLLIMLANCGQRVLATAPTNVAIAEEAQRCAHDCAAVPQSHCFDQTAFCCALLSLHHPPLANAARRCISHAQVSATKFRTEGVDAGRAEDGDSNSIVPDNDLSRTDCHHKGARAWQGVSLAAQKPGTQFAAFADREGVRLPPGSRRRDLLPGDLLLVVRACCLGLR